ncbi:hypothetical protein BC629DRAFT_1734645 [Irpex lacteus]|nr:hypothetical protein BC629DRAFT_1734645 [Irpex lacteus]
MSCRVLLSRVALLPPPSPPSTPSTPSPSLRLLQSSHPLGHAWSLCRISPFILALCFESPTIHVLNSNALVADPDVNLHSLVQHRLHPPTCLLIYSPSTAKLSASNHVILGTLNSSPSSSLFYPSRSPVRYSSTSSPNTPLCLRGRFCTAFRLILRLTFSPQSLVLDIHTNVHPLVYHSIHCTVFTPTCSRSKSNLATKPLPLQATAFVSFFHVVVCLPLNAPALSRNVTVASILALVVVDSTSTKPSPSPSPSINAPPSLALQFTSSPPNISTICLSARHLNHHSPHTLNICRAQAYAFTLPPPLLVSPYQVAVFSPASLSIPPHLPPPLSSVAVIRLPSLTSYLRPFPAPSPPSHIYSHSPQAQILHCPTAICWPHSSHSILYITQTAIQAPKSKSVHIFTFVPSSPSQHVLIITPSSCQPLSTLPATQSSVGTLLSSSLLSTTHKSRIFISPLVVSLILPPSYVRAIVFNLAYDSDIYLLQLRVVSLRPMPILVSRSPSFSSPSALLHKLSLIVDPLKSQAVSPSSSQTADSSNPQARSSRSIRALAVASAASFQLSRTLLHIRLHPDPCRRFELQLTLKLSTVDPSSPQALAVAVSFISLALLTLYHRLYHRRPTSVQPSLQSSRTLSHIHLHPDSRRRLEFQLTLDFSYHRSLKPSLQGQSAFLPPPVPYPSPPSILTRYHRLYRCPPTSLLSQSSHHRPLSLQVRSPSSSPTRALVATSDVVLTLFHAFTSLVSVLVPIPLPSLSYARFNLRPTSLALHHSSHSGDPSSLQALATSPSHISVSSPLYPAHGQNSFDWGSTASVLDPARCSALCRISSPLLVSLPELPFSSRTSPRLKLIITLVSGVAIANGVRILRSIDITPPPPRALSPTILIGPSLHLNLRSLK